MDILQSSFFFPAIHKKSPKALFTFKDEKNQSDDWFFIFHKVYFFNKYLKYDIIFNIDKGGYLMEKLINGKYYLIKTDHEMIQIAFWNDRKKIFEENTSRGPNYVYPNHVIGVLPLDEVNDFREYEY